MTRIVMIEDNKDLAYGLANNLEIEGYEVLVEGDGAEGLRRVLQQPPDLLILDLMLPGMDGYRILKSIREAELEFPVLILSARGEEVDKVRGFRVGADDYVTKPFGILELLARIEALLRRVGKSEAGESVPAQLAFGDVTIDTTTRIIRRGVEEVILTPKEYELLVALVRKEGAVISRDDLLHDVWGHGGPILTRTVDTHIAQLRRKLERDPAHPDHILTVRKVGYRLAT